MEILNLNPQDLKPDKNQPRKEITDEQISEMAISIKNEGIINPIEIDKNNIIITGEVRWRASIEAGLKEVPCKILEIDKDHRFIRQMHENMHHNTMSAMDTAEGLKKTIEIISSPGEQIKKVGRPLEIYIDSLSELYGIARNTVSEFLALLSEDPDVQKALRDKTFQRTKIRSANKAPEIFRDRLKKKVVKEREMPRDAIDKIVKELNRAEKSGEIEKGKEILEEKYDGMTTEQIIKKVDEIYPTGMEIYDDFQKKMDSITRTSNELMKILEKNPLNSFPEMDAKNILITLGALTITLRDYMKNR
jgi:ParB family chromosome partitioning protein